MTRSTGSGGRRRAAPEPAWKQALGGILPSRTPRPTGITIPPPAHLDSRSDELYDQQGSWPSEYEQQGYDGYQGYGSGYGQPGYDQPGYEQPHYEQQYHRGTTTPGYSAAASSYHPAWSQQASTQQLQGESTPRRTAAKGPTRAEGSRQRAATVLGSSRRTRRTLPGRRWLTSASPLTLVTAAVVLVALLLGGFLLWRGGGPDTTQAAPMDPAVEGQPNGVESLTADLIAAKALEASKKAGSVRMRFDEVKESSTYTVDVRMVGTQGQGSVVRNGVSFEFLRIDGRVFIKGSEAFNKQTFGSDQWAKVWANYWLVSDAKVAGPAMVADFADFGFLTTRTLPMTAPLTKGKIATIDGRPAIEVRDATKVIYVATRGEPYVLGVDMLGGDREKYRFSQWGQTVQVQEPPADKQFDMSKAAADSSVKPGPPAAPSPSKSSR